MSILDYILNIFKNDKKNAQIYAQPLQKTYGEKEQLEIGLYDDKTPITDTDVTITLNGVKYNRKTDSNGIARLNINLQAGQYQAILEFENNEYNKVKTITDITIKPKKQNTYIDGINLTMNQGDGSKYQCAVYDEQNQRIKDTVNITINGITYNRKADNEGLYKLNINLNQGTYPIRAEYLGNEYYNPSTTNNTITINPKKEEPKTNSFTLNPYMTNQGCKGMGQCTSYYCACNSVQQAIYRLTGELISESTLASVGGTTTNGTGHEGINTMIAWFNRNYNYTLDIQWKNFSEIGYTKLQEYINKGAVFFHLLYRNQWGHYEVPKSVGNGTITVLNSLGNSCGNGTYCGYIETRNQSTQTSYINGISQKSVCIITRRK